MKKFVVLIFAIAGLAFLSEPTARAGVHFSFGFPVPFPAYYGPGYYDPYSYYGYPGMATTVIPGMATTGGITGHTGATGITMAITATATMVEAITGIGIGAADSLLVPSALVRSWISSWVPLRSTPGFNPSRLRR